MIWVRCFHTISETSRKKCNLKIKRLWQEEYQRIVSVLTVTSGHVQSVAQMGNSLVVT